MEARARRAWMFGAMGALLLVTAGAASPPDGVLRATLDNGLRVVIVPNRLAPVVTTMVNYLVGANEVPAGFPGLAHAEDHMMSRGSPGLSADQLAEISAAIGGSPNAHTGQTVTQNVFSAPGAHPELELQIPAIRLRGPHNPDSLGG